MAEEEEKAKEVRSVIVQFQTASVATLLPVHLLGREPGSPDRHSQQLHSGAARGTAEPAHRVGGARSLCILH